MDVFNEKELEFSIVNSEEYDRDTAKDTKSPFSFLDFIKYTKTEYAPDRYSLLYSSYLKRWYAQQELNETEQKEQFKEYYRQFIQEVIIKYTTETERRFLSKINYNDPLDLDVAIPFYANKLTEVATFYKSKREEGKYVIERNKLKGSVTGIERSIFDNIYDYVVNSDDVLLTAGQSLSSIVRDFDINIQEYVDVYGDYFDLDRDDKDEDGVRKMLYENNLIDIDPNYYFDPDAYNVLLGNAFIKGIGNFKINAPAFSEAEILSLCDPENSAFDELNLEFTKGGLTLSQVYELKRQLISKYVSSDFYYLNTTQTPATSGLLFEADSPTNNLLNLQTADIAAVQSNEQKLLRDVGLFFKPDDFGIFKLNGGEVAFELDEKNIEQGMIYIFPDPNIYGNVGVNAQSKYPYVHTFDFRGNIRNVSSGVATGDPRITNKSLTFEPYSVKQRELQELFELNTLGYKLNFSDLYNKGAIRKLGYDCFGNEYALFKPKQLQSRSNIIPDSILNLLLDGHKFYDDIFNEGFTFDYTVVDALEIGDNQRTVRSGMNTNTNGLKYPDEADPYYLFFRNFTPYEELVSFRSLAASGEVTDVTAGVEGGYLDGAEFTDGDGNLLVEDGPSPYFTLNLECSTFEADIRNDFPDYVEYDCVDFNTNIAIARDFDYGGDEYDFINEADERGKTVVSSLQTPDGGTINVERVLETGTFYIKDQGTSLSYPASDVLSSVFGKYSDSVNDDIRNNIVDFDIINDAIIVETPSLLLLDKLSYRDGNFIKPNTTNTLFFTNSSDSLERFSNRFFHEKTNSVYFAKFATLSSYNGEPVSKNYWSVYPEIYEYSIKTNKVVRIWPKTLDEHDIDSFRTSLSSNEIVNFAPDKVVTPKIAVNSSFRKLKLTYIVLDQNNLSHIHDCLFEWKSGLLTLNKVVRYTPDNLGTRTTTFGTTTNYACIKDNTSIINASEIKNNNHLVIY